MKERKIKFPRKNGNYVIVLAKVKGGMAIEKFDSDGTDVTIQPSMYNLNEVIDVLRNQYRIEVE